MNKKGFTLVELLGVLVILSIILAIAVPTIMGIIKGASKGAFESDAKMLLKAIDYKKLENESFDPTTITKDNIGELLGLSKENYFSVNITVEENVPIISVIGEGKWDGLIACGTYQNMSVVESSVDCSSDLVAPVVSILGDSEVSLFIGDIYSDAGATAIDNLDGDMTNKIVVTSNVNTAIPGSYTVTYSVTDSAGNEMSAFRTIIVIDNVAPNITFNPIGSETYIKNSKPIINVVDASDINTDSLRYLWTMSTTQPAASEFLSPFTNNQSVDTPADMSGSYYLWAMASDAVSNQTIARSDAFNLDNESPVIAISGNQNVTINKNSVYSDAGATVSDNVDAIVGVTSSGTVNPSVIGTYIITYNASDSAGNTAIPVTRTVNVIDVLSPVITILGSNPATVNVNTVYSDAGSTALDDADGDVTSDIVITGNVNSSSVGTYTVTYTVSDSSGNVAVSTRTVNVIDTTAPTVVTALAGTMLFNDPTFATTTNSTQIYNNSANGNVAVTRVAISGAPVGSGYGLEIKTTGVASPGWGGFYFANQTAASKVFITRIVAKIPAGYTINWASNAFGGGTTSWLTSQEGTGTWKEYLCQVNVGTNGVYSSTNFFFLTGGTTPSLANPLIWHVAYATVHDTTKWGTSNNVIVTSTDAGTGIVGYGINQSSTIAPTYTAVTSTASLATSINNITANGTYYVWVKDASLNADKKALTISYIDRTSPTISLLGSSSVTVDSGTAYTDAGATATDNASGNITSRITVNSNVNSNVVGTYTVTYNVVDDAGNTATPITRTVIVKQSQVLTSTTVTFAESTTRNQTRTVALPGLVSITSVTVNTGTVSYTLSGENINLSVINGAVTRTESVPNQVWDCWNATCCYTSCWSCSQSYTGTCCGCPGDWPTNQSCCSPCQSCGYVTQYNTVSYYSYTVTIGYYKKV